jgi:hypothetical protein
MRTFKNEENEQKRPLLDHLHQDDESPETKLDIKSGQQQGRPKKSVISLIKHRALRNVANQNPYKNILSAYSELQIRQLEAEFMFRIENEYTATTPAVFVKCASVLCIAISGVLFSVGLGDYLYLGDHNGSQQSIRGNEALMIISGFGVLSGVIGFFINKETIHKVFARRFLQTEILTERAQNMMSFFESKPETQRMTPVIGLILAYEDSKFAEPPKNTVPQVNSCN